MSGNHASRRKAGRAKHLAAYRADGRFSSLSAFIENERLAAALRGEPTFSHGAVRLGDQVLSFDAGDMTLSEIASKINEAAQGISTFVLGSGIISMREALKGTSNVSIGSISPKR